MVRGERVFPYKDSGFGFHTYNTEVISNNSFTDVQQNYSCRLKKIWEKITTSNF